MYGPIEMLTRSVRPLALAAAIAGSTLVAGQASARGPEHYSFLGFGLMGTLKSEAVNIRVVR